MGEGVDGGEGAQGVEAQRMQRVGRCGAVSGLMGLTLLRVSDTVLTSCRCSVWMSARMLSLTPVEAW